MPANQASKRVKQWTEHNFIRTPGLIHGVFPERAKEERSIALSRIVVAHCMRPPERGVVAHCMRPLPILSSARAPSKIRESVQKLAHLLLTFRSSGVDLLFYTYQVF